MKLNINRNKKILLGLGCILALVGFLTFVGKYFNVIEGYAETDLQLLQNLKKSVTDARQMLAMLTDSTYKTVIDSIVNPDNVNKYAKLLKISIDDLIKVINTIFPGTYPVPGPGTCTIEGLTKKEKRKNKAAAAAAAAEAAEAKAEAEAAAAEAAAAAAASDAVINKALKIAIISSDNLINLYKTIETENPIVSKGINNYTPSEKIIWWCTIATGQVYAAIKELKNKQGM